MQAAEREAGLKRENEDMKQKVSQLTAQDQEKDAALRMLQAQAPRPPPDPTPSLTRLTRTCQGGGQQIAGAQTRQGAS